MISIVCVFNNKDTLEDCLLRSLGIQTSPYEPIFIDNRRGRFRSAAEALNHGGAKATGKYIMFVHQDVEFISDSWLGDAEKLLDSIADLGIAGVAGISRGKSGNAAQEKNVIKSMGRMWGQHIKETVEKLTFLVRSFV